MSLIFFILIATHEARLVLLVSLLCSSDIVKEDSSSEADRILLILHYEEYF